MTLKGPEPSSPPAPPAGVGMGMDPPQFLQPGDTVRCEIDGIGSLTNTVR